MDENAVYTVKQLAALAGVTPRALHFYDEIGLLRPARKGANGYRYYDETALLRLQQILFYREMGLDLARIQRIVNDPEFDRVRALQSHRRALEEKIERLKALIHTVDATIMHLVGEVNMSQKNIFDGFSPEKQKEYEQQAHEMWGDTARQSTQLWNSYSEERKQQILREGSDIYSAIAANLALGPTSAVVQALLARWHEHLRNFYEPSIEVLEGLGAMYHDHPDFNATFTAMHPDLPAFLKEAIACYTDELETRWLEQELGVLRE